LVFFFPFFLGWVAEFGTGFYGLLASNFRAFSGNSNLTAAPWVASYQTLLNFGTQNVGEMFFKRSFDQRPIIRDF
jgi:hypothetical protein